MAPMAVEVYIYDLAQGMAAQFSQFVGFQLDGIWHTAIVCFGHEWFFGGGGIQQCLPGTTPLGQPLRKVHLGETRLDFRAFMSVLDELGRNRFAGWRYNLLDHNCNNFSDDLARRLTGNGIPQYILELPQKVKASPIAALLAPLIQNATPTGGDIHQDMSGTTTTENETTTTYRHFPHSDYMTFDQVIEPDKLGGKLLEVIQGGSSSLLVLLGGGETAQSVASSILSLLSSAVMPEKAWRFVLLLLSEDALSKERLFPVLDAVRWFTAKHALKSDQAKDLVDRLKVFLVVSDSDAADAAAASTTSQTNMQLSAKILCNLLAFDESRKVLLDFRESLVSMLNSILEQLEEPTVVLQIAISTLAYNYALALLQHHQQERMSIDQEASFQLVSALCTNYIPTMKAPEALYRTLVALGTLVVKDPEVKDLALALDVNLVLGKLRNAAELAKLQECIQDCKAALA